MPKQLIACQLTTAELNQRKSTTIASLKNQLLEKKELATGYSYKFNGDDSTIDGLITFVKDEKRCCPFFNFNIKITGNRPFAWLTITGPKGTRDFIDHELQL